MQPSSTSTREESITKLAPKGVKRTFLTHHLSQTEVGIKNGFLVIGVVITIVIEAGGGGQQQFEIMNSLSAGLVHEPTAARQIPIDSTIDNDFSPTESYVVLCPCDKGFQYWSFR
eukprot:scaffold109649_cov52-Attheya_sp.AAC.1